MPAPYDIKRLVITGDFLRLDRNGIFHQCPNIRWLHSFLAPIFSRLTKMPVPEMIEGRHLPRGHAQLFYAASAKNPALVSWIEIFNSACNPRQLALLADWFGSALVTGFELPEIIINGLTRLDIPFIDFAIHPVRFLRDLAWGVRSNIEGLHEIFASHTLSEDAIKREAELIMAKYSRFPAPDAFGASSNSALLACQSLADKVLIHHKSLYTLPDFYHRIHRLCQEHDVLLVKEHPYEKQLPEVMAYLEKMPNVRFIQDNFYRIISQPSLTKVYSISSSCSIEAKYFNKCGVHFTDYPLHFSYDRISPEVFLSIDSCLHISGIWKEIFKMLDIAVNDIEIFDPPVNYRSNLTAWWDAKEIFD